MEVFLTWLPDDEEWARIQGYGSDSNRIDLSMDYEAFVEWNKKCWSKQSVHERAFLASLQSVLRQERMTVLDLETCSRLPADCLLFDQNGCIVLVSRR